MKVKFRKPTSPAFNLGEVWVSANGVKVIVLEVFKDKVETNSIIYYNVRYLTGEGLNTNIKDCWNFQVRYNHISDMVT